MYKLQNIPLNNFRRFLDKMAFDPVRITGGHEVWQKEGLTRNLPVQTHVDPVPIHVVKQCQRLLGLSTKDFLKELGKY